MKRDMDLLRLLLLKIEDEYHETALRDIDVKGYDRSTVAYHCKLAADAGLVSSYNPFYADDGICSFSVGSLTWEGCDYLDKIRDDSMWTKVKDVAKTKGIPLLVDTVKTISSTLISAAVEGATNAYIKNSAVS